MSINIYNSLCIVPVQFFYLKNQPTQEKLPAYFPIATRATDSWYQWNIIVRKAVLK